MERKHFASCDIDQFLAVLAMKACTVAYSSTFTKALDSLLSSHVLTSQMLSLFSIFIIESLFFYKLTIIGILLSLLFQISFIFSCSMDNSKQAPKVPFSELGQVDSDFTLAKILQDQERAFMILAMDRDNDGNDSDKSEENFIDDDTDYNDREYVPLEDEIEGTCQVLEEIEEVAEGEVNDHEEEPDSQDPPQPEDLSYEELTALGELVGKESRGLPKDELCAFSSSIHKCNDSNDECVICQVDYEEGEALVVLPCKHQYHADCINKWLQMRKVCPICSEEVSSPAHGHSN